MSTEDNCKYYGCIIKFYKTINSHKPSDVIDNTEYLVWMNFDGMKVIPISSFGMYAQSLNIKDDHELDLTCERQKLYLYSDYRDKDIFGLRNKNKYDYLPLIVITMIDFDADCMDKENLNHCIRDISLKYKGISGHEHFKVEYEIMETLSSHDYIIVFRSNSYNDINNIIFELRTETKKQGTPLNSTYSILAIDKDHIYNWTGDDNLYASIRISLNAQANLIDMHNLFGKAAEGVLLDSKGYTTFGKFDMGIEGILKNNKTDFLELYTTSNIFDSKNCNVYMTNTRFLNRNLPNGIKDSALEQNKTYDSTFSIENINILNDQVEKAKNMINRLEASNVSNKLEQSILRLILRISQINISVYTKQKYNEYLWTLLDSLIILLEKYGEDSEPQEQIAEIVTTLNILLDNRFSSNTRDFEIPQRSMRFSGSSSKLLIAYSNVVNDLFSIVKIYKESLKQPMVYLDYVTADIDCKITSHVYFPYDKTCRFINIKIPIDMMFNTAYVIPWLVHEIGHFMHVGYTRMDRNRSYFSCVFSGFNFLANEYFDENVLYNKESAAHVKTCNVKCCHRFNSCSHNGTCSLSRFKDYCMLMKNYMHMYIIESGCGKSSLYKIPENVKGEYIKQMKELCENVKNAYEETIADVFMIYILEIKDCEHYLRIVAEYMKNNCIKIDNSLNTNHVIRITAIMLLFFKNNDSFNFDHIRFKEYINCIATNNKESLIGDICDVICNKTIYYDMANKLQIFLQKHVVTEMETSFIVEDIEEIKLKIENIYKKIQSNPDDFAGYIDFINEFAAV